MDVAKSCPGTRIYALTWRVAEQVGYDYYAKALHVDLIPLAVGGNTDLSLTGPCPTVLWFAHYSPLASLIPSQTDMLTATERAAGLSLSTAQRNLTTATYTNPGVVVTIPPPP